MSASENKFKTQNKISPDEFSRLRKILDQAVNELKGLDEEPLFIAQCPHKFNDACYDDLWYGVQIGRSSWTQSHFFEEITNPLIREYISSSEDTSKEEIKLKGSLHINEKILEARKILKKLQEAEWYDSFKKYFPDCGDLLGLRVQRGQGFLCESTPNCSEGYMWIWNDEAFLNVSICNDRFDQYMQESCDGPKINKINIPALKHLTIEARKYFIPVVSETEKYDLLTENLIQAAHSLRKITQKPIAIRSSSSDRPSGYANWRYDHNFAVLWFRNLKVNIQKNGRLQWQNKKYDEQAFGDEIERIAAVALELEKLNWRELYTITFNAKLNNLEHLSFYIDKKKAILICRHAVYSIETDGLKFLGICDRDYFMFENKLPKIMAVKNMT